MSQIITPEESGAEKLIEVTTDGDDIEVDAIDFEGDLREASSVSIGPTPEVVGRKSGDGSLDGSSDGRALTQHRVRLKDSAKYNEFFAEMLARGWAVIRVTDSGSIDFARVEDGEFV